MSEKPQETPTKTSSFELGFGNREDDRKLGRLVTQLTRNNALKPEQKLSLIAQINQHCVDTGKISPDDLTLVAEFKRVFVDRNGLGDNLDNFPNFADFTSKLDGLIEDQLKMKPQQDSMESTYDGEFKVGGGNVSSIPTASEVALYGVLDQSMLADLKNDEMQRAQLWLLGIWMSQRSLYEDMFKVDNMIEVDENWQIKRGGERAVVLKVLDARFVRGSGMDEWIDVVKVEG